MEAIGTKFNSPRFPKRWRKVMLTLLQKHCCRGRVLLSRLSGFRIILHRVCKQHFRWWHGELKRRGQAVVDFCWCTLLPFFFSLRSTAITRFRNGDCCPQTPHTLFFLLAMCWTLTFPFEGESYLLLYRPVVGPVVLHYHGNVLF